MLIWEARRLSGRRLDCGRSGTPQSSRTTGRSPEGRSPKFRPNPGGRGTKSGHQANHWSSLEVDRDPGYTLLTWDRAAFAVGAGLDAFIRGGSAADRPRDAVHLKAQELVIRRHSRRVVGMPEEMIDREARTSRAADVLLHRRDDQTVQVEYALMEVIDWFADVGAPLRDWSRRLGAVDSYAVARMRPDDELPITIGCWIVRSTKRNRDLVAEHRNLFRSRFLGSGHAWSRALTTRKPHAARPSVAVGQRQRRAAIWFARVRFVRLRTLRR